MTTNLVTPLLKKILIAITLAGLCLAVRFCMQSSFAGPIIGIILTASHTALDAVRHNFEAEVIRLYGAPVQFRVQNGEGNTQQLYSIASQFSQNESMSLLFCIATRAVQAALSVEAPQPIIFSAVTDASVLKLETSTAQVTGNCDMIDLQKYIDCICHHVPLETIAIVFNPADLSSVAMVETCTRFFVAAGKKIVRCAVAVESEMPLVAATACTKADGIFCPIDNTVAVAIDVLAQQAKEASIPLMVCDGMLLRDGVLCAGGVSYAELGKAGAQSAVALLKGKKTVQELPVAHQAPAEIVFHTPTAQRLGVIVPANVLVKG